MSSASLLFHIYSKCKNKRPKDFVQGKGLKGTAVTAGFIYSFAKGSKGTTRILWV